MIPTEAALEERLSRPDDATIEALRSLEGDFLVLGAGGKMGPTLAVLAKRGAVVAVDHQRAIGEPLDRGQEVAVVDQLLHA